MVLVTLIPLLPGKGANILRENGIKVTEDFMREECDSINQCVFPLYYTQNALCCYEVRHDN